MTSHRSRTVAYVLASESGEVLVQELDPQSGSLGTIEAVALRGAPQPMGACPMAVSPDQRFLYVALRSEPFAVAGFAIEAASGRLSQICLAPLPEGMAFMATDRSGRNLLSTSHGPAGGVRSVSPIDVNGMVGEPTQVLPTTPAFHSILPDPSNRFVLYAAFDGDMVIVERFDDVAGVLSPHTPQGVNIRPKSGPRLLRYHPNGKFVYLLGDLDGVIHVLAWNASDGTLQAIKEIAAVPNLEGRPFAGDFRLTPNGAFIYASLRSPNSLSAFRVDGDTGELSPIEVLTTVQSPRGFNIDSEGRYLLAAGQVSNDLAVYAIESETGRLTLLQKYEQGRGPNWVELVTLA